MKNITSELDDARLLSLTAQSQRIKSLEEMVLSLSDETAELRSRLKAQFNYYARFKTLDPVVKVYRISCEPSAKKLFQPKYCYRVLFSFLRPDGSIYETWLTATQFFGSDQFFRKPRVKVVRWGTEYITIKLNGKETVYNYKGEILDTDWCLPSLTTQ